MLVHPNEYHATLRYLDTNPVALDNGEEVFLADLGRWHMIVGEDFCTDVDFLIGTIKTGEQIRVKARGCFAVKMNIYIYV